MSAPAAPRLVTTPSRQARRRLAILATTLAMALGALFLSAAWLWPQAPSRVVEVPIAGLRVGVPKFIRPFDMGSARGWGGFGVWVVAHQDGRARAFYSRGPGRGCAVVATPVVDHRSSLVTGVPGVALLEAPFDPIPDGAPTIDGFRELCRGSTFTQ